MQVLGAELDRLFLKDGHPMTQVVWPAVATLVVLLLVILIRSPGRRLPPGPRGWPILGSLLSIGPLPQASLYELSKQYGPLMLLRLGNVKTLVVTSPQMAQEILKTHDQITSGRPLSIAAKYHSYGGLNIAFAPPGEYWRYVRKILTNGLLTPVRIKQFQERREQEALACLHYIVEESQRGNLVNMSECLSMISMNNTCQIVMSKSYSVQAAGSPSVVPGTIRELLVLADKLIGAFNIADYVPLLKPFDPQGLTRQVKDVYERLDKFLADVIEEHRQSLANGTQAENCKEDFIHAIFKMEQKKDLQERLSMDSIKAILMDVIPGAADTASNSALWAIVELVRHPPLMRRVQEELDSVVGSNRLVQEEDLPKLKYLDAVIKETYRLHPVVPLLLPHQSTQDFEIQGFHIPAKTQIMVNVWAIHRNPAVWERPLEFDPDRFLDSKIDFKGKDFQLLPFGSGRRMCPGLNFGSLMVPYTVAFLVHALDLSLPEGQNPEEFSISERFGILLTRKLPLVVSGKARLPKDAIYPAENVQNGA